MTKNEHTHRLERLLEISCSRNTALDLKTFLHALISAASELTGCEAASLLEIEETGEQLRFLALPGVHRDALQTLKVPLDNSVAGWVFQNARPAVIPDVNAEPRHFKGVDQAAGFVTRSLMAVPVMDQSGVLGVLEVVNKAGDIHYTEDDLKTLEILAAQAAIAIQNARLTSKVQKSQEEMVQLDRMKSDFIAIASHELRTPLGLILGHSTFLRDIIEPEYRPQLDIIVRNAMRLKEIIDSIASMDNAQRGMASLHLQPVYIKNIVEEVLVSFHQESEAKHVSLESNSGPDELLVEGDAIKITIALSNLVKNALAFVNPNGHIMVSAESILGYVKVSVIDDGIGIPTKDLTHIFERFYQVESHLTRTHGGMGLGLSVVKVMVEMHGGRVWAESVEGKGSNFTIILPVESSQANAANRVFSS